MCLTVPSHIIANYTQKVRVLVFCHKIDCMSIVIVDSISLRTSKLHYQFKSYSNFNVKNVLLHLFFCTFYYAYLKKVKNQIYQLHKDFVGKSNGRTLVSDFKVLAHELSNTSKQFKKKIFWVVETQC